MKKSAYRFVRRLIGRITSVSQPNNDSFTYYGHFVNLQSGTRDYVAVTIYRGADMYSGSMTDFTFDFWTKQLHIEYAESDSMEEAITTAFRSLYNSVKTTREKYDD